MKKSIYIFAVLIMCLFSCQNDEINVRDNTDNTQFQFNVKIPQYKSLTRAASYENTINNMWLLTFDANGFFLKRVQATNLTNDETNGSGYGSFVAQIPENTGIIHFIANYENWDTFSDTDALNKDEKEIIPTLRSSNLVFWGRSIVSSTTATLDVTLYHNQAKVTVENEADNFNVTGFALCNFTTAGTVAPFNASATPSPFVIIDNIPTLPVGTLGRADQTADQCDMNPKYMHENQNTYSNQAYIIIRGNLNGEDELYYKIQFLDSDRNPYRIVRNYLYRLVIREFSNQADGSRSFEEAKNAQPANNLYAEILKESPTISDNDNNVLTVSNVNFLFTQAGNLNVTAHYTENGVNADDKIMISVVEDESGILSNVNYNGNGNITANVAHVAEGQSQATILVRAGVLSRELTVISSVLYSFEPVTFTPEIYTDRDQDITLNFNIPDTIPYYLFPLKCEITTQYLYPVEPNKDIEIEFTDHTYKFVHWATGPGTQTVYFKTSLENSDETVTIENEYFHTGIGQVQSYHFEDVSINGNNLVNYGQGSPAELQFTFPEFNAGSEPELPVTVSILTNNLTTNDPNWTRTDNGYSRTYTSIPTGAQTVEFLSNKAVSYESITLSASGFRNTIVPFENILGSNHTVTGGIYVQNRYSIAGRRVISSDHSIAPDFTPNTRSQYAITLQAGSNLKSSVTFSVVWGYTFTGTYTVEQLLASPVINLQ